MSVDSIITASDKLIEPDNSYLTLNEISDPGLIIRAECFQISGSSFFVDLVFSLNRTYRRRLALSDRSVLRNDGLQTKVFKQQSGVFSELAKVNVKKIIFYVGEGVQERVMELQGGVATLSRT